MVDNNSKKLDKKQECVQVVVRCRPFSTKETNENRGNIIAVETALFQVGSRTAYTCFYLGKKAALTRHHMSVWFS